MLELRTEGERDGGAEVSEVDDEENEGEGDGDCDCIRLDFVDFVDLEDLVLVSEGDGEVIRKGPLVCLFKAIIEETSPGPSCPDTILKPTLHNIKINTRKTISALIIRRVFA